MRRLEPRFLFPERQREFLIIFVFIIIKGFQIKVGMCAGVVRSRT